MKSSWSIEPVPCVMRAWRCPSRFAWAPRVRSTEARTGRNRSRPLRGPRSADTGRGILPVFRSLVSPMRFSLKLDGLKRDKTPSRRSRTRQTGPTSSVLEDLALMAPVPTTQSWRQPSGPAPPSSRPTSSPTIRPSTRRPSRREPEQSLGNSLQPDQPVLGCRQPLGPRDTLRTARARRGRSS